MVDGVVDGVADGEVDGVVDVVVVLPNSESIKFGPSLIRNRISSSSNAVASPNDCFKLCPLTSFWSSSI